MDCRAPGTSFVKDNFFHRLGVSVLGGWFQNDSSALYLLCPLLHQLYLRSSGIRSQNFGDPCCPSGVISHSPAPLFVLLRADTWEPNSYMSSKHHSIPSPPHSPAEVGRWTQLSQPCLLSSAPFHALTLCPSFAPKQCFWPLSTS